jgi:hypothetical protein
MYRVHGIIDMPSAEMMPDTTIGSSGGYFNGGRSRTITAQLAPRISARLETHRFLKLKQDGCGADDG